MRVALQELQLRSGWLPAGDAERVVVRVWVSGCVPSRRRVLPAKARTVLLGQCGPRGRRLGGRSGCCLAGHQPHPQCCGGRQRERKEREEGDGGEEGGGGGGGEKLCEHRVLVRVLGVYVQVCVCVFFMSVNYRVRVGGWGMGPDGRWGRRDYFSNSHP